MEEFLRCKICHEFYDNTSKRPLILPCGHTLCEYCMKIIFKANQVKCPFDKKVHSFSERQEIGINHQIYDFFLSVNEKQEHEKCTKHKNYMLKFYCCVEKIPFCEICYLNDHLGKNHEVIALKHTVSVENIRKKLKELQEKLLGLLAECKENSMEIEESFINFEKELKQIKLQLFKSIDDQSQEFEMQQKKTIQENKAEIELYLAYLQKVEEKSLNNLKKLEEFKENEQPFTPILREILEESNNYAPNSTKISSNKKEIKTDNPFPLLSFEKKENYLKAQNPAYNSKTSKMIKILKEKGALSHEKAISTLMKINRNNYLNKKNDKSIVDIYKCVKFGYNYNLPSPLSMAKLLEEFIPSITQKNVRVLEVGCGCGYSTACLANLIGKKGKLISLENNENLLKMTKKNIEEFNPELCEKIEFYLKDYKSLDFLNDQKFHLIYVSAVLQNFPMDFENLLALNGIMWVSIGSGSASVSNYIFEKDKKGEVRTRRIDIPVPPVQQSFFDFF